MEKIEKIVRDSIGKNQSVSHKIDHLLRVRSNALKIAENYKNIDKKSLELAAMLHDVCHPFDRKEDHVTLSTRKAEKIMKSASITPGKIKKVLHIISEHSTEDMKKKTSIESKILFDADKLDGLGVIGIARVFALCGQQSKTLEESISWYEKKIKIVKNRMQTEQGKRMAEKLMPCTQDFLEKLKKELKAGQKYCLHELEFLAY